MHVMPFTDRTIAYDHTDASIIPAHPHPLRSHHSSTDILAEQLRNAHISRQQQQQQDQQPTPPTDLLRRGNHHSSPSSSSSTSSTSSRHRRSPARTSIDISSFCVPSTSAASAAYPRTRSPPRFRDDPNYTSSTASVVNFSLPITSNSNNSCSPRDYPIVPVRPPLRPTVSFGAISQHSYDSTVPIIVGEKMLSEASVSMVYEKRESMEGRSVKPAWNRKMHDCFSCCFGGRSGSEG